MEEKTDILGLLDLMTRPGFCVKDDQIIKVNSAARSMLISEQTNIHDFLITGMDEYKDLKDGCLSLCISLSGVLVSATVTQIGEYQVFVLQPDDTNDVFDAMALIARELRKPLDSAMQLTDQLFQNTQPNSDAADQAARLNRGLHQILRIVSNLSYPASGISSQEVRDAGSIVDEIMEKATHLLSDRDLRLCYKGLSQPVYTLVDSQLLERALLNLLSNAVKFTPSGGQIQVSFSLTGKKLQLQVQDSGSGIADHIRAELFSRYLRQPGIEDSRQGLGLGMLLVQQCARIHGGVVLADKSSIGGSRITMTIPIRQQSSDRLHAPLNLWLDYAGGRDHTLVELSDCLSSAHYDFSI